MSALEIPEIREWLADLANLDSDVSRLKFLEIQCGADKILKNRVWDAWRSFQYKARKPAMNTENAPAEDPEDGQPPVDSNLNQLIGGKYKLLELIGEGGMGSIYKAQEVFPVKSDRFVALKLVKSGLDSKKVLARFRAERTAIGVMDHPAIAKIFDAGATPSGLPFFVMELVPGEPITTFCDKHRLTVAERLKLFIKVCDAIQHAHQKGVIHRDIKPSNILVMNDQGQFLPKVIDFGVAKALWAKVGEETPLTAFDSIIGTPEYMSPEQASFNTMEVDTRTDVYSLGVLLYEIIIGSTPFDRRDHAKTGVLEMLRHVRENDPPTPSIKLSTQISLSQIAATRNTEANKLANLLKGELDWIILKALDKDPDRRYESPAAFGRDIQRYLDDEVVEARPPAALYQAGKFFRRHKLEVISAGLVLLALIGGIIGTTAAMVEARAQSYRAEQSLEKLRNAVGIVTSIYTGIDPQEQENSGLTLGELLGRELDRIVAETQNTDFGDDSERTKMLLLLGNAQKGLGNAEMATQVLSGVLNTYENTLPPDHPTVLESLDCLGRAYFVTNNYQEAIKYLERAYEGRMRVLGAEHKDTLESMGHLALAHGRVNHFKDSVHLLKRVVKGYENIFEGKPNRKTLYWMAELGAYQLNAGDYAGAKENLETSYNHQLKLSVPKTHSSLLYACSNLGRLNNRLAKHDQFLKYAQEAHDGYQEKYGQSHQTTLFAKQSLSEALMANQKIDPAIALAKTTYLKWLDHGPKKSTFTLNCLESYNSILSKAKKVNDQLSVLKSALDLFSERHGASDAKTLQVKLLLGTAYADQKDFDNSIATENEVLRTLKEQSLQSHKLYGKTLAGLASAHSLRASNLMNDANPKKDKGAAIADLRESASLYEELIAMIKKDRSDAWRWQDLRANLVFLSTTLVKQEKWAESEKPLREALTVSQSQDPSSDFNNVYKVQLGFILWHLSQWEEAESLSRAGLHGLEKAAKKDKVHLDYIKKANDSLKEIHALRMKSSPSPS